MLNLSKRVKRTSLEKIYRTRMANMKLLAKGYKSQADMARVLDVSPVFISHLIGENPKRTIGEKLARDIEVQLGLHTGWLDIEH